MIIVQPMGGLCNRMRAIASAVEFAKRKHTKVMVLWQCNAELNASFEKLFTRTKEFKVINFTNLEDIRIRFLRKVARVKINDSIIVENRINGDLTQKFAESIRGQIFIQTCLQFFNVENHFKMFRPSENINKHIASITDKFVADMVGVHIRRTDQVKSIEYSKTENFIELMHREVKENPQVCFYLATDDMKEEEIIRKEFPDRIISNEKRTLARDSEEGMFDAVVDLYCLAKCNRLIGSYWSSFTDIAAALYGIDAKIAGIDN